MDNEMIETRNDWLSRATKAAASIADEKSTFPGLGSIAVTARSRGLVLEATDLDHWLRATIPCSGEDLWATAVPAKALLRSLSLFKGETTIALRVDDSGGLVLSSGSITRTVNPDLTPIGERPKAPDSLEVVGPTIRVAPEVARSIIDPVEYARCIEEERPHLCNVSLEIQEGVVSAVATDGHRLSIASRSGVTGDNCVVFVSPRAWRVARAALPLGTEPQPGIEFKWLCGRGMADLSEIRAPGISIVSRTVTDPHSFPPYRQVVPSMRNEMAVAEAEWPFKEGKGVVSGISKIADKDSISPCRIYFNAGESIRTRYSDGSGSLEQRLGTCTVGSERVAVDPTYLRDAVGATGVDSTLRLFEMPTGSGDRTRPVLEFSSEVGGVRRIQVVMPMAWGDGDE